MIFTKPILSLFLLFVSPLTIAPFAHATEGNDSDLMVDHDFKLAVRLEMNQDIDLTPQEISTLEERKSKMHCPVYYTTPTHNIIQHTIQQSLLQRTTSTMTTTSCA